MKLNNKLYDVGKWVVFIFLPALAVFISGLGEWGDGEERNKRLKKAGYDASAIQKEVNRRLNKNKLKADETVAREVIQGK